MPRLPRIRLEGAIYYVTSRASQDEQIFKDKEDYRMYLELVSKYKSQHKFKLFSYSLHPDRLELLIETGDDATISEIMHDLNSLYTKYFNGRYQKHGHLFESRFRSVLVEKARFLLSVTKKMHANAQDNPYSSFHIYTGVPSPAVVPMNMSEEVKEVLGFLQEKDDPKAYERYVLEGDKKEAEALEKSLKRGQVLGSESFQALVKEKVREHAEQQQEEKRPSKTNPVVIAVAGALVLVATSSAVYLYVSRQKLANQYAALIQQKNAEFTERTKFENRSPLALSDLEGTQWKIERIDLPADRSRGPVKDTLHFTNGRFYSDESAKRGFMPTNVTVTKQPSGVTTWETIQSNSTGDTVSWRGDWQGDVMKGVISEIPAGKSARDASFYSLEWSYAHAEGGVS